VDTTALANGTHTLTARATDGSGNVSSATATVTVSNLLADAVPPTAAIAMPAAGATISGAAAVAGSASDNVRLDKITLQVDGVTVGTVGGTASWSYSLNSSRFANGAHTLTAIAFDAAGNQAASQAVAVTVNNAACADQCTLGSSQCASSSSWQVCSRSSGSNSCTSWSPAMACPPGSACVNGACQLSCTNQCPVAGAVRCNGNVVETCGDQLGNRCLQWGASATCAGSCSLGACGGASCVNTCRDVGATRCDPNGNTGYQVCATTPGGCTQWGPTIACAAAGYCVNGACQATLQGECSAAGATRCDPESGAQQSCVLSGGQLKWGAAVTCGDLCTWGACRNNCVDQCLAGQTRCDGQGNVQRCGQNNADGCLEWPTSGGTACASGSMCVAGLCVPNAPGGFHTLPFFYRGESHPYDLYVPASYAQGNASAPVLLGLHGSCEAGDSEVLSMGDWASHAETLGVLFVGGKGPLHSSSTAGGGPPAPGARCWEISGDATREEEAQYLLGILTDLGNKARVDSSRVYAEGGSGGAYIACQLAMLHSDVVKGAGLMDGECNDIVTDSTFIQKHVPFFFFDGSQDYLYNTWVVPRYQNLNSLGYHTSLVSIAGAGHQYFPNQMLGMWSYLTSP
jgi:poly(3-hydroxybutyrate) depolymerase